MSDNQNQDLLDNYLRYIFFVKISMIVQLQCNRLERFYSEDKLKNIFFPVINNNLSYVFTIYFIHELKQNSDISVELMDLAKSFLSRFEYFPPNIFTCVTPWNSKLFYVT